MPLSVAKKNDFADVIQGRFLRWGDDDPGSPGSTKCKCPYKEKGKTGS